MPRAKMAGPDVAGYDPPAMNPDDRYDQLISLAVDLAEERLRDKTASNQLIAEIIRYGSAKNKLEKEKMQREIEVLRAKTDALKSQRRSEEMYERAIQAMQIYQGRDDEGDEYDEEY